MIARITRVVIRNYKSIAKASVDLEPFTALVGPNGSGKSNFLDALAFVRECLAESVELAFKSRSGIAAVRRRSAGHPTHIAIRLDLQFDEQTYAQYAFEVAARPKERFQIARERCIVERLMDVSKSCSFEVRDGRFVREIPGIRPKVAPDRLALYAASATEEFRPVYDFLTSMCFYSVVPTFMREYQEPHPGDFLTRDGRNAASVLNRLKENGAANERYDRLCRLLAKAVPGVTSVDYHSVGPRETLHFKQDVGLKHPWTFEALSMSDGTLRVLGVLLALYQPGHHSLIAFEEPEATVHPAVAEMLVQALLDATHERQILVTTHSPDILDQKGLTDSQIRVVTLRQGETLVGPMMPASRAAIRERLYTPGELLRSDELRPDIEAAQAKAVQDDLFGLPRVGSVEER